MAHLKRAYERQPSSGALASQMIEYAFATDEAELASQVFETFERQKDKTEASLPFLTLGRLYIGLNQIKEAQQILARMPISRSIH